MLIYMQEHIHRSMAGVNHNSQHYKTIAKQFFSLEAAEEDESEFEEELQDSAEFIDDTLTVEPTSTSASTSSFQRANSPPNRASWLDNVVEKYSSRGLPLVASSLSETASARLTLPSPALASSAVTPHAISPSGSDSAHAAHFRLATASTRSLHDHFDALMEEDDPEINPDDRVTAPADDVLMNMLDELVFQAENVSSFNIFSVKCYVSML